MNANQPPYAKGDPRARKYGKRGGRPPADKRRKLCAPYAGTILDLADAAGIRGVMWAPARTILKAAFALPMTDEELTFFTAHTNRATPPIVPVSECWLVAGRRGGKSRLAALVAFYLGI